MKIVILTSLFYVDLPIHTHAHIHAHMHAQTRAHTRTQACAHIHARAHTYMYTHTHTHIYMHIMYTGCFRGNLPCFRRMSLRLNHINITKNAYRTFTEIMAKGVLKNGNCYGIIDYKIHIKTRIKLKCTKF
jgi:hypothetical protein